MERNMDFIEELKERFLRYVAFDTQSDPESETFPSTAKQLALLNRLVEEMISLGMTEVEIDPNGYCWEHSQWHNLTRFSLATTCLANTRGHTVDVRPIGLI